MCTITGRAAGARFAVALIALLSLVLLTTQVASAHVSVLPAEAPPDTNQTFSVRVPNEKDDQGTVKVRIELPAGMTVSRFQPKPGWTREIEKNAQGQMTAVTWSGAVIGPAEFEDFTFQARTPKDGSTAAFKAFQTYQGGETVEWVNAAGQERPAPMIALKAPASAASATDDHGQAAAAAGQPASKPSAGQPAGSAPAAASGSDLSLVITLATGTLAVMAIVLSGVALSRRARPA